MDRLVAMAMFVRVVESGSFSAVARELDTTQPNVSKQVRALEARLGSRLIARSTRQLSLTDEGRRYYEDCRRILDAVDAAEHSFLTGREVVAGPLRIAAPVSFGRRRIAARLGNFLDRFPQVSVELLLSDDNKDLVADNIDVALRLGPLADSGLIARALGQARRITAATPGYLARRGEPRTPTELAGHDCLVFTPTPTVNLWHYRHGGERLSVSVGGRVRTNSSEAIRELALAGLGIARAPRWLFCDELADGRIVPILRDYEPEPIPIHAVSPANRRQSARVHAFIDYLASIWAADPQAGITAPGG